MRVIIAGSRSFNDYALLVNTCDSILDAVDGIKIVSGTANGADKLGEKYALEKGHQIKRFPADWAKNGKSAGYIRNEEMAKYADMLIAFWDDKSRGTMHMINLAKKYNLEIKIVKF